MSLIYSTASHSFLGEACISPMIATVLTYSVRWELIEHDHRFVDLSEIALCPAFLETSTVDVATFGMALSFHATSSI